MNENGTVEDVVDEGLLQALMVGGELRQELGDMLGLEHAGSYPVEPIRARCGCGAQLGVVVPDAIPEWSRRVKQFFLIPVGVVVCLSRDDGHGAIVTGQVVSLPNDEDRPFSGDYEGMTELAQAAAAGMVDDGPHGPDLWTLAVGPAGQYRFRVHYHLSFGEGLPIGSPGDLQRILEAAVTPGVGVPLGKPPGRNCVCPCGSGKKYKKCHGK